MKTRSYPVACSNCNNKGFLDTRFNPVTSSTMTCPICEGGRVFVTVETKKRRARMKVKQRLSPLKERERIYKILELYDATNKASWWNIADAIYGWFLNLHKKVENDQTK